MKQYQGRKNGPGIDYVYMFNQLRTMDEIYARMPRGVIGVEDWNRYDGIAYYYDQANNQRYSRNGYPIANDEMCKYGEVFKVKIIKTGEGNWDYKFEVLSRRPDTDAEQSPEMPQPTGAGE